MTSTPTLIETPDDAIESANLFIQHINADPVSAVVQCEFVTSPDFRVKDASDIIIAILKESNIADTRKITTNVGVSGSHPGRRFTISATQIR